MCLKPWGAEAGEGDRTPGHPTRVIKSLGKRRKIPEHPLQMHPVLGGAPTAALEGGIQLQININILSFKAVLPLAFNPGGF